MIHNNDMYHGLPARDILCGSSAQAHPLSRNRKASKFYGQRQPSHYQPSRDRDTEEYHSSRMTYRSAIARWTPVHEPRLQTEKAPAALRTVLNTRSRRSNIYSGRNPQSKILSHSPSARRGLIDETENIQDAGVSLTSTCICVFRLEYLMALSSNINVNKSRQS